MNNWGVLTKIDGMKRNEMMKTDVFMLIGRCGDGREHVRLMMPYMQELGHLRSERSRRIGKDRNNHDCQTIWLTERNRNQNFEEREGKESIHMPREHRPIFPSPPIYTSRISLV
jgi:hypothetical protein